MTWPHPAAEFDYRRLLDWSFQPVEQSYGWKDTVLYALGLGIGHDPLDPLQLRYAMEDGLIALPTMAVTLASAGFWLQQERAAVDWRRVLHGEQGLIMHRPLKPQGRLVGRTRNDSVIDKGPGRGALLYSTTELIDAVTQEPICTLTSTAFLRSEGGLGGSTISLRTPQAVPDSEPEQVYDWPVSPQAALLYRLSGDLNPLHASPIVASDAGFSRPILHGLATYGIAGYCIVRAVCRGDASLLRRLDARFTAPVFPGETLRTEIWQLAPGRVAFRVRAVERDVIALSNGLAEYF